MEFTEAMFRLFSMGDYDLDGFRSSHEAGNSGRLRLVTFCKGDKGNGIGVDDEIKNRQHHEIWDSNSGSN